MSRRAGAMVAVNLLLFFVFAELLALGFYFVRDGSLFYTHRRKYDLIQAGQTEDLVPYRIQPYFGFSNKPGRSRTSSETFHLENAVDARLNTTNNYGFYSDHDYPLPKSNPKQYFVGIVGGSVAEGVVVFSRDELIQSLRQHPFLANKEIIVLNFAHGGYKQPQQLLVLSYFLSIGQPLDMVINIDGFNEIALGAENNRFGLDISMPQASALNTLLNLIDPTTLTPDRLESLVKIRADQERLDWLATTMNSTFLASLSLGLEQYYTLVERRYQAEVSHFEALKPGYSESLPVFIKRNAPLEEPVLYERIATQWATSSILIEQMLAGQGIAYYHFLQPNQYYSSRKPANDEEARQAYNLNHPYRPAAIKGYPALLKASATLAEQGVRFFNAAPIFDRETIPIYRDDCCHYNKLGYELLARFIADSILASGELPKP